MDKIKIIALDMDGTLLNDEGIVTVYTKKVIRRALDRNIKVLLSTGRPLEMCISFARDLRLPSYIITSNGAEIYTAEEKLVEQHTIDPKKMEQMWQVGHARDLHMWLVAADAVFTEGRRPSDFTKHDWLKMGYGNLTEANKLDLMEQLKSFHPVEITNSSPSNIEVNGEGVNKAQAVQSVCKQLGITMDRVMAVGDSLNDLSMIKEAGVGVAVANAQEAILEIADYVTGTNNEDGVAKAIERFAL